MAELAQEIVIDRARGVMVIDGVDFPYHVAERGPTVDSLSASLGSLFVVNIPVLCTRLHLVDVLANDGMTPS